MEKVAIADLPPSDVGSDAERRSLTEALGATDVALNRYHLAPGDRLAGLHAHADQEEIFVVLDGTLTFETLDGTVAVDAGETVRFAPGEYQSGTNESGAKVTVLAIGAPRETGDLLIPVACPDCGATDQRLSKSEDSGTLVCQECGTESTPRCPECAGQNLRAVLADDGETPVSVCRDCGAEWE